MIIYLRLHNLTKQLSVSINAASPHCPIKQSLVRCVNPWLHVWLHVLHWLHLPNSWEITKKITETKVYNIGYLLTTLTLFTKIGMSTTFINSTYWLPAPEDSLPNRNETKFYNIGNLSHFVCFRNGYVHLGPLTSPTDYLLLRTQH